MNSNNFHQNQPVLRAGVPLDQAQTVMLLLHGRGASAEGILGLATYFHDEQRAYLAPQAAGNSWWPRMFIDPLEWNAAWLRSALGVVDGLIRQAASAGIPAERVILAGFSQGAVLAAEYAASHARGYGGLLVFSGGLFGPPGAPRDYSGSLAGTPVFIGCSAADPYIPLWRVEETAVTLERLGGRVSKAIYPGATHTITMEEIEAARRLLDPAI